MLFTTVSQFAVLALLLFAGWLFGFASNSSGRKWRAAYDQERAARTQERDALTLKLREAEARTAELERARPVATSATAAVAASAARPAMVRDVAPAGTKRGWFDWSARGDDLTRLRGVDGDLMRRLRGERIGGFADLAGLSDQDELALEHRLDLPAGYIQREQLREQARLLADRRDDEHARRFG